ncbi:MAG: membrane protein insertase YidC [Oscillospiraceae bacterium]|nr:membrane protein insertase YidC [Oscillospiraceae bacterium]
MSLWDYIVWPFARLMEFLYNWTQNYGLSVILFAIVVNIVLLPFMAKSKKGMMRTTRLQPQLKELEKKYNGNPQKYQAAVKQLYKDNNASPTGGCLWSFIPFPILIALYGVIRRPLNRMMGIDEDSIVKITQWVTDNAGFVASKQATYDEIRVVDLIHKNWDAAVASLGDFGGRLINLDYSFIGLNLGDIPKLKFWAPAEGTSVLVAFGLFMIPVISAFLSWASMKVSQMSNPQPAGNAGQSMKAMNLMMPLMSIYICFIMPAALGVYWIANSLCGMAREYVLTKIFKRQLEKEDAERIAAMKLREEELERKREETERLRAEDATTRNTNTSKKKIQAKEKQASDVRRAAAEKAEREARRERLGIEKQEIPASQVGNRRYARGRNYDPARFDAEYVVPEESSIPELEDQLDADAEAPAESEVTAETASEE